MSGKKLDAEKYRVLCEKEELLCFTIGHGAPYAPIRRINSGYDKGKYKISFAPEHFINVPYYEGCWQDSNNKEIFEEQVKNICAEWKLGETDITKAWTHQAVVYLTGEVFFTFNKEVSDRYFEEWCDIEKQSIKAVEVEPTKSTAEYMVVEAVPEAAPTPEAPFEPPTLSQIFYEAHLEGLLKERQAMQEVLELQEALYAKQYGQYKQQKKKAKAAVVEAMPKIKPTKSTLRARRFYVVEVEVCARQQAEFDKIRKARTDKAVKTRREREAYARNWQFFAEAWKNMCA